MITEGFDPSIGAPTLGSFSIKFKAGTERKLLGPNVAASAPFTLGGRTENWKHDTISFTPTELANPTAASVLESAVFSARCDTFTFGAEGEPWTLSGNSILAWLGTGDNPGVGPSALFSYDTATPYTGTLADWLLLMIVWGQDNGLTLDATTLTATALNCAINGNDVLRHALNQLVIVAAAEYFCHPTGVVEFQDVNDTAGTVFTWDPTVLIGDGIQGGREAGLVGYEATIRPTFDYSGEGTTARMSNADGTASGSVGYGSRVNAGFDGFATPEMAKFYGADDDLFDQSPLGHLIDTDLIRSDSLSCQVDAPLLRRDCKPGDWLWFVSERTGIIDTTNVVNFGGRTLPPEKRKLTGLQYPFTAGMGAYVTHDSTGYLGGGVQNVTEDVIPETGKTTVTLDTTAPKTLRRAVLGSQFRPTWRKA